LCFRLGDGLGADFVLGSYGGPGGTWGWFGRDYGPERVAIVATLVKRYLVIPNVLAVRIVPTEFGAQLIGKRVKYFVLII
jgi:hypothetical protein